MLLDFDDEGPGPVVVLIHGFPFDRTMWEGQIGEVGSIYRIIAPDLRGHGRSEATEGVYSMDLLADDVIETLDSLNLTDPVVIGGLSMGGYVALSIAKRYPNRLRGLILMNTKASADSFEAGLARTEQARLVESEGKVDLVVDAILPRLFSPTTRERRPDLILRMKDLMLQTSPLGMVGALRGMATRPDRTADLAGFRVPTLVLAGQDDVVISIDEAHRMAGAIPNARFAVVPDGGHLAPLENTADSNALILDFLKSIG